MLEKPLETSLILMVRGLVGLIQAMRKLANTKELVRVLNVDMCKRKLETVHTTITSASMLALKSTITEACVASAKTGSMKEQIRLIAQDRVVLQRVSIVVTLRVGTNIYKLGDCEIQSPFIIDKVLLFMLIFRHNKKAKKDV